MDISVRNGEDNVQNLIYNTIFSGIFTLVGLLSTIYGIKRIPEDYGVFGHGCKNIKGAFIYNFFGMGGMFLGVFSGMYFVAMVLRLITYIITHCEYMLV